MRIFIFLVVSIACCSGRRSHHHHHSSSSQCSSTVDDKAIQDLKNQVATLTMRLGELSSNLQAQTMAFQKMMEDSCIKEPTCPSTNKFPSSCAEATALTRLSGIYNVQLDLIGEDPFLVACDESMAGGGWTVIQSRMDGSIDFFRDWNSYKAGFGNLQTEFFIGLDKLHALTNENGPQELLIVMSDFEGVTKYAKYSNFIIGSEMENYALKDLGTYSGDAGDALKAQLGMKFSTKDKDNDIDDVRACAELYKGGWWYSNCHRSNLNGLYLGGPFGNDKYAQGITWRDWHGNLYSMKDVKMMIRPRQG